MKSELLKIADTDMDYVYLEKEGEAKGKKLEKSSENVETIVVIPGLGDALCNVRNKARSLARDYKEYLKKYRIFVFSRRNKMPEGFTIEDMADDLKYAMDELGIKKAHVMGTSQGGLIAQALAIRHPEVVDKLVLIVTFAKPEEDRLKVVKVWKEWAKKGDCAAIVKDTIERSFSKKFLEKHQRLLENAANTKGPESYDSFIIQADACVNFDSRDKLDQIKAKTLVVSGDDDRIIGGKAGAKLAAGIKNCKFIEYEGLSHAADEEAEDFDDKVLEFLAG